MAKGWADMKHKDPSPEAKARVDRRVRTILLEMELQELREMAGKTQGKVAKALGITQPQVSQFEHREDFLLSTLKRYVEALGGELEVRATFGDRSVRIRSAA
jgi:predicted XRE-type DNA-binding protein